MSHNPGDIVNDEPFTETDLERILQYEKSTDIKDGWTLAKETDLYETWRWNDPNSHIGLVKGFLKFKGIPPNIISDIVQNVEIRTKWDTFFSAIDVLEKRKHSLVVYWLAKMPYGISDRDLVQSISHHYDESTDTTFLIYRNTIHPDRSPRSNIVRAETIFSSVIIRPDPDDPGSSKLSLMLQTDMKGWIPHFMVNAFAVRAPAQWQTNLSNYYWNVYLPQQQGRKEVETDRGRAD